VPVTFVYVYLLSLGAAISALALLSCSLPVFLHVLMFLCGTRSLRPETDGLGLERRIAEELANDKAEWRRRVAQCS